MWNVKKKVVWWWETNETQRTPSEALSENGGRKKTRIGDVKWKKLDFRASRGALAVAVWAWCARRCRVHVWRVLASSGIHRHERISLRGSPYSVLVFHFTLHLSLALRIIFSHEIKSLSKHKFMVFHAMRCTWDMCQMMWTLGRFSV